MINIFDFNKVPKTEENEELIEDFLNFYAIQDMTGLFTDEHSVGQRIQVDWAGLRGVVAPTGGGYRNDLTTFATYMEMNEDSNEYQRAMRQILLQSKGQFRVFMLKIQASNETIERGINSPHDWSTRVWQAVYYDPETLNMPTQIRNGR